MEPSSPARGPAPPTEPLPEPPRNPWFGYVRVCLLLAGGAYVVLGLVLAPLMTFGMTAEDELPVGVAIAIGVVTFIFSAGFGVLNFVAARGLKNETKWGWILSIVIAAIYAPSICLPLGAIMLVGLLQDDVRKRCIG
jgi:hypothetical protein